MSKKITIDGPTTELNSGEVVCIGYYEDSDGLVVDRFAVESGDYQVVDAVHSIQFVESLDQLPSVDSQYVGEP